MLVSHGVESDALALGGDEGVVIPEGTFELVNEHYAELQSTINQANPSDSYGIDLYENCLAFVYGKVRDHPGTYGELM